MSTSHLPRDKKDRSIRRQKHDPYKAKGKLREPSVCRQCKAVYHKGRWTWDPVPSNSHDIVCPACERIRDGAPSGVLLLTGECGRTTERLPQSKRVKRQDISRNNLGNHNPKTKRRKLCQNKTRSNECAKIRARENRPQPRRENLCGKRCTTSAKASMERAPPNRPSPSDYPKPGGPG